jgi:hypothetical protein
MAMTRKGATANAIHAARIAAPTVPEGMGGNTADDFKESRITSVSIVAPAKAGAQRLSCAGA